MRAAVGLVDPATRIIYTRRTHAWALSLAPLESDVPRFRTTDEQPKKVIRCNLRKRRRFNGCLDSHRDLKAFFPINVLMRLRHFVWSNNEVQMTSNQSLLTKYHRFWTNHGALTAVNRHVKSLLGSHAQASKIERQQRERKTKRRRWICSSTKVFLLKAWHS